MNYNDSIIEEYKPRATRIKRIIALILSAALLVACFPISVFATEKVQMNLVTK